MSAAWLARKLATVIGLAWLVATIVFLALHMVPGDPAELLLSTGGVSPDPASVAELRDKLGLDRPILVQYGAFLGGLPLTLGYSYAAPQWIAGGLALCGVALVLLMQALGAKPSVASLPA